MKATIHSIIAGTIAAAASLVSTLPVAAQDEPVNLTMASFNVGGSWYIYATAIAGVAQGALSEGSTVEVLPYQGGVGNPILVNRGEADMGLSFSALSNWAYKGTVVFDEPHENVRALVGGLNNPHRLGIVVRTDAGIDSLDDVAEVPTRLVTVQRGGAGEALARMALDAYGLDYSDIEAAGGRVTQVDLPVAIQQMRDGQADMFIHNIGYRQPDVMELALGGDVTFIALGEGEMNTLAEEYGLQPGLAISPGEFEGVAEDVPSVGYPTGVIANAEMPDDVAYAITRAIVEKADTIRAAHASLADFDPEVAGEPLRNGGVPLHPGAERFYREQGWLD
ncbi:TAXI family TRAP transporter solute-binding subunit [Chelativorans sp. M5D2P16]|uniref:TAXI family TRAP transporter solute-binding subunit n=1 Tax=Chelativorans sp. M5D2P16 TaxID=3095678 RepID=UPI002ACA7B6D|nr:TAXI family TRAP transporter solute-binding subunit [Chelativorans sp. M5D2P16]MDZ5699535.1 TAXI family TRAP transporter solute-binding subunit [Chelativorans sp. M5D2P16]